MKFSAMDHRSSLIFNLLAISIAFLGLLTYMGVDGKVASQPVDYMRIDSLPVFSEKSSIAVTFNEKISRPMPKFNEKIAQPLEFSEKKTQQSVELSPKTPISIELSEKTPQPVESTESASPPAGSIPTDISYADLKNAKLLEVVDGLFERTFKNGANIITLKPKNRELKGHFFDLSNPMSYITPTYSIYTLIFEGTIIITPDDIDVILSLESATKITLIDKNNNFIASSLAHRAQEFKKLINLKELQISLPTWAGSASLAKSMQSIIKHSPPLLEDIVFMAPAYTAKQIEELEDELAINSDWGVVFGERIEDYARHTITFRKKTYFNDDEVLQTLNSERLENQVENLGKSLTNAAYNAYEYFYPSKTSAAYKPQLSPEQKSKLDAKNLNELNEKTKKNANNGRNGGLNHEMDSDPQFLATLNSNKESGGSSNKGGKAKIKFSGGKLVL